ncbi:hypothetical protein [Aurantiacibacter gilvus]|uniref:Uncharacterized protein n=1 Tax=Aurantiacibacter gilvus TaxID=3139141 RepID=A0ABU9IHX0_9SPHN
MASSPELYDEPARPKGSGAKPPITASPAFRWVVAIWFAALLGVGSLVVPVVLLERASLASGLASILPQAAPPLGFTARALIAGGGTIGGALLGLLLARLLVRDRQPKPAKVTSHRPLSPAEDLAELDDIDEPAPPATIGGRRRALAIAEEERPSDFLNLVPLPGFDDPGEPIEFHSEDPEPEPVEESATDAPQSFQPIAPDETEQTLELDPDAELTDEQGAAGHAVEEFLPSDSHVEQQEFIALAEASEPVVEKDGQGAEPKPEPKPVMEPLAFSPPSMARPVVADDEEEVAEDEFETEGEAAAGPALDDTAVPESEEDVSDKPIFDAPESAQPTPFDQPAPVAAEAGEDQGEGLVQLVQRLGATLEKHREWSAEQAAAAAVPAPAGPASGAEPVSEEEAAADAAVPEDFDPAAADEAAEAMAAWFGSSPAAAAVPAKEEEAAEDEQTDEQRFAAFANRLASVREDEDEDDVAELAATFSLPLPANPAESETPHPSFDQPPAAEIGETSGSVVEADDEEDEDDSADSEQFASLNPYANRDEEFVRIDEPEPEADSAEPAVLFPGQESRRAPEAAARAFDPPVAQAENASARAERPKPSNDDNERALREALMNLQRMSK